MSFFVCICSCTEREIADWLSEAADPIQVDIIMDRLELQSHFTPKVAWPFSVEDLSFLSAMSWSTNDGVFQ
jgi:hypothetical protein